MIEDPRDTVDEATTFVMRRETAHINSLVLKVNGGDETVVDELFKEKQRLNPKGSWDHEEVFIATGGYFTGKKCFKKK
jgi:hypothetical protein